MRMNGIALALAAAAMMAGAASAQDGRRAGQQRGFEGRGDRMFQMADANRDGQISREEFRAGMERMRERRMERRAMRMRGEGPQRRGGQGFGMRGQGMQGMRDQGMRVQGAQDARGAGQRR